MDYLSSVRVLDADYKIKDEEAARINHTHNVDEIEGAAKEGHQHQASEIDGLSAVATSGSYSDLSGKPSAATESADGLMSAADKAKLDGIQAGASSYAHPTHTAHESGLYKVAVDSLGHVSSATAVTKSDITALGIPAQDTDTTYGEATADAAGLMSAADKAKLDDLQYNHVGNVLSCNISGNAATATEIKAEDGVSASLEKLPQWTATPTDSTQLVRRDTNGTAEYGRVTFRTVWNYIKGKADAVYAAVSHTHPYLPISGGTLTGNVTAPKFVGGLQGTADAAKTATTASRVADNGVGTANVARHVWFSDSGIETARVYNDAFRYNPVGNMLSCNVSGSAATAGSATTAAKLAEARTVSISGAVSGSAKFDGSGNVNISTKANESYISSPISGLYNMGVDADGNLWVYHSDSENAPNFEYDPVTGNLYYVTEA